MPKALTNPFAMLYQNLQQRKALACSPLHEADNSCLKFMEPLDKYFLRKAKQERQQNLF